MLCFSEMADKKRKILKSSRNKSYENKFSKVVKSIERWVMDTLQREKNGKGYLCNDIAQIISEICGIS